MLINFPTHPVERTPGDGGGTRAFNKELERVRKLFASSDGIDDGERLALLDLLQQTKGVYKVNDAWHHREKLRLARELLLGDPAGQLQALAPAAAGLVEAGRPRKRPAQAMAGPGRPWPAMASHGRPWPAMASMASNGQPWPLT